MDKPDIDDAINAVADYNSIVLRRMVPELVAYIERLDQTLQVARIQVSILRAVTPKTRA